MKNTESPGCQSVFRTEAWVQAWIDTWGKDPRIQLIDLGGREHPLEQVYLIKHRLKKLLPVNTLCLAGVGFGAMSTPRAEYNDLGSLITMAGGIEPLQQELRKLKWQQFIITDIDTTTTACEEVEQLAVAGGWRTHIEKNEFAYAICDIDFQKYLASLGSNTRLTYFNRRSRLALHGEISFREYQPNQAGEFFKQLNTFHLQRWGKPCYSPESQSFMQNFIERLTSIGGKAIMQAIVVNGEIISVLFDICWKQTRYNFQSGYAESRFPKISLGAIHFGYAIQASLEDGLSYDFMAGRGKQANYKESIANRKITIKTFLIERNMLKSLRRLSVGISELM